MACPHLEYRRSGGDGLQFDHERAYCGLQEAFVSPMKADICNDRGPFHHSTHCEIHIRYESKREPEDG